MDKRLLLARVAETALSVARSWLANPERDPEIDPFLAGLVDACHNVGVWLVQNEDPYAEFPSYITGLRPDVREWLEKEVRDAEAVGA